MNAHLIGIARRDAKRAPMQPLEHADITVEHGVARDSRGKPGPRQVTVLAQEDWDAACAEIGMALPWTVRRANLLVSGLRLPRSVGANIIIGTVRLVVCDETNPCQRMDEAHPGLKAALTPDWRGGVLCRVAVPGAVAIGDPVAHG